MASATLIKEPPPPPPALRWELSLSHEECMAIMVFAGNISGDSELRRALSRVWDAVDTAQPTFMYGATFKYFEEQARTLIKSRQLTL